MREEGAQVEAPDIVPGRHFLPCPLGSGSSAARGHPLGPAVSPHYPEAHRPSKVPRLRRPSGRCKVSVAAQLWLPRTANAATRCAGRSGQSGRAPRPRTTRPAPASRRSHAPQHGRHAGGAEPGLCPHPDLDSQPKTPPRLGPGSACSLGLGPHLGLQPPNPLRAPPPGPSLPGARRGRLRSAAPAPRRASRGP